MATSWEDPIKKTKHLSIFPTSDVTSGAWAGVFSNALTEFNKLSSHHHLGVTVVKSATPPDPSGPGGADVQFDTLSGTKTFMSFGQQFSQTLDGNGVIAATQQIKTVVFSTTRIAKAFIYVPATPSTSPPNTRVVGDPVKLVIAVHELIHACGLENSDHTGTDGDVFFGFPSLRERVRPADDRLAVGSPAKELPPIVLVPATVKLIQANWK
jgi:hypothetical protein